MDDEELLTGQNEEQPTRGGIDPINNDGPPLRKRDAWECGLGRITKLIIYSPIGNWIIVLQQQFRLGHVEAVGRMVTFIYADKDCKQGA